MDRLTPSQASALLEVNARTLRRWAAAFSNSLSEGARKSRRTYNGQDIETLRRAAQMLSDGLTITQTAERLPVIQPDDEQTTALVLSPEAQMMVLEAVKGATEALTRLERVEDELRTLRKWAALPFWRRLRPPE